MLWPSNQSLSRLLVLLRRHAKTSASGAPVVRTPALALRALPGQGRADLHPGQRGNDFHRGAAGLYSREVVQQAVTKDAKDGGMVT